VERFICIHGHFYQPPRENAWLESIETQDSAYPYHDWNERITEECYAPNGASRILDGQDRIVQIVNNYARISFNFGPTLLAWMEEHAPDVYETVLDADKESQERFSGHGSAIAQAYNHLIMPLANRRDKVTQVKWGIDDFVHRFGRQPEGMWLPETAVDTETLDIMAEHGIKFTVLTPYQAAQVRPLGSTEWQEVGGGKVDPKRPYAVNLPSGRSMAVFFYDGPASQAVAFEKLLLTGERFAERLLGGFAHDHDEPQLMHIATDGETYGHHHRFGDMALAFALDHIESNNLARITNYGEFLELYPSVYEAEIIENTSWSCAHGVERWRSNCGDNSGGNQGWNQEWRGPLREALDWLRLAVAPKYEEAAKQLLTDPWAARDAYINVVLDRSSESFDAFFGAHATRDLMPEERVRVLKLLELQRHAMLMYTSCGWFFDELSGIETVQVMQYAGRVAQLSEELFGEKVEGAFLEILGRAQSNIRRFGNGQQVYERFVNPSMVDWERVAAHFAVSSLFESYPEDTTIHCYHAVREDEHHWEVGKTRLLVGRATFTSAITTESATLSYGVVHLGDHNVSCGVRFWQGTEQYDRLVQALKEPFERADYAEMIRLLDYEFGESTYSLRTLFKDEQRKALNEILAATLAEDETTLRQRHEQHSPLLRYLSDLGSPLPQAFLSAAGFVVNTDLRLTLSTLPLDVDRVRALVADAETWQLELDADGLGYLLTQSLNTIIDRLADTPDEEGLIGELLLVATLAKDVPLTVDLWQAQNRYFQMLQETLPLYQAKAGQSDKAAEEWVVAFTRLGEVLAVRVA
jgi:alpha-amylase/alpha-mannosidase (GH57 family)